MLTLPSTFPQYLESSDGQLEASVVRISDAATTIVDDDLELNVLRTQSGLQSNLKDAFLKALEIVHEFLCLESERFKEARVLFQGSLNAGITACKEALAQMFPVLQPAKQLIVAAFRVAWKVGVAAFCRYMSSDKAVQDTGDDQ